MADTTPPLDELRREIDEIDTALHDLLMRRTAVAKAIGAAKGNARNTVRPGREAKVLRRLIARHGGSFPKVALVRTWREIVAAMTAVQGPFSVAVFAPNGDTILRSVARFHYGSIAPITAFESTSGVLRAVSDGTATLGVLPYPEAEEADPWWRVLARNGADQPRVVGRLPFAAPAQHADGADAVAVGLIPPEASGEDCSFLVVETAEEISRSALVKWLEKAGIVVNEIMQWDGGADHRLHLIEAEGFIAADDVRLQALQSGSIEAVRQIWTIGSYAKPFTAAELSTTDESPAS